MPKLIGDLNLEGTDDQYATEIEYTEDSEMIGISININKPDGGTGGGGGGGGYDPDNLGTDIVLSGDNYIVETDTASATEASNARSITTKSDNALYYFEIDCDFAGITQAYIGVCNANHSNTARVGYSKDSIGLYQNGAVYSNSGLVGVNGLLSYSDPCTIRVWFNPSTGNVWFGKDGNVVGTPSTQTNPFGDISSGDFSACVTPFRVSSTFTINATSASISYSAEGATPLED